jgi:hypothetical protein
MDNKIIERLLLVHLLNLLNLLILIIEVTRKTMAVDISFDSSNLEKHYKPMYLTDFILIFVVAGDFNNSHHHFFR